MDPPPPPPPSSLPPVTSLEIVLHDRPRRPVFCIRSPGIGSLTVESIKSTVAAHLKVFAVDAAEIELRTMSGHLLTNGTTVGDLHSIPPLFRPASDGSGSASSSPTRSTAKKCPEGEAGAGVAPVPVPEPRFPTEFRGNPETSLSSSHSSSTGPGHGRVQTLRVVERRIAIAVAILVDRQQMVVLDGMHGGSTVADVAARLQRVLHLAAGPRLFNQSGVDELDGGLPLAVVRCRYRKDDVLSQVFAGAASAAAGQAHLDASAGSAPSAAVGWLSTLYLAGFVKVAPRDASQQLRDESPVPRTPSRSLAMGAGVFGAGGGAGAVAAGGAAAAPQLVQVFKTFDHWDEEQPQPVSIQHSLERANASETPIAPALPLPAAARHGCATEPRQVTVSSLPTGDQKSARAPGLHPSASVGSSSSRRRLDVTGVEAPTLHDIAALSSRRSMAAAGDDSNDGYSSGIAAQDGGAPGSSFAHQHPPHLWGRFVHTVQPAGRVLSSSSNQWHSTLRGDNSEPEEAPQAPAPSVTTRRFADPSTRLAPGMTLGQPRLASDASVASARGVSGPLEDPASRSASNASSARTQFMVGGGSARRSMDEDTPYARSSVNSYRSGTRQPPTVVFDDIFVVGSPQPTDSRRRTAR